MERRRPVTQPAFAVDTWPDFWTEADLAVLPDDGHRYEIIDGSLIVNPPPTGRHQSIVTNLLAVLRTAAPPGWRVLHDIGVRVPGGNFIADGVALRPGADLDAAWQEPSFLGLVIEVASPSTELIDRLVKAPKYAEVRIPAYWRIGRDGTLTVHEFAGGAEYAPGVEVKPGDSWSATVPFPVTIEPAVLIA
jgi:Uma2 family endonuclease